MTDAADMFWLSTDSAELYEKYLIPGWFNTLTAITMAYAGDLKDKALLDIATGTGIVPRFASKKLGDNGKIVGIDFNKGMLAVAARLKIPQTDFLYGDAAKLPFDDVSFDIATCQQGFQFFPDKPASAKEMYRVLKPGGRVVVTCWSSLLENPAHKILVDAIEKHYGKQAAQYIYPPFAYSDKTEMRATFKLAGFRNVSVETRELTSHFENPLNFVAGMVGATPAASVVNPKSKEFPAFRAGVLAELKKDFTDGPGIKFPMHSTYILADK